jgi:hypothetical protein
LITKKPLSILEEAFFIAKYIPVFSNKNPDYPLSLLGKPI